jgi:hypothetical protein
MAEVKDKVMDMVRKELDKNPDAENRQLYEKATKVDGSIADLTLRQFHARYPLQVKRQKAQKSGGGSKSKRSSSGGGGSARGADVNRDKVRATLLQFAKDVSSAEGQASTLIDVLENVDDYVDQVVRAVGGGR